MIVKEGYMNELGLHSNESYREDRMIKKYLKDLKVTMAESQEL